MLFTSYKFFIFLPLTALIYFFVPKRLKTAWLLVVSYAFCAFFGISHIIPLFVMTLITYICGICIENAENTGNKKKIMLVGVIASTALLVLYKYLGFLVDNTSGLLSLILGRSIELSVPFSLVQPIGISYLVLQIISYIVDVYRGDIKAERDFISYALYVSFFPKIVTGPIQKAETFFAQLKTIAKENIICPERIRDGATRMLWGYFLKFVISERMSLFSDTIFSTYNERGCVILFLGISGYCLQLAADFIGSMDIALGVSGMLGISLDENFKGSFFSKTVTENWKRWHMTLGRWFIDYIYIPIGGSRKGRIRTLINRMIIFAISGLWHGAAWHYVAWGLLNGFFENMEDVLKPFPWPKGVFWDGLRVIRTALLWMLSIIFFRSQTVRDGALFVFRMFTIRDFHVLKDGSIFELGLSSKYFCLILIAAIVMAVVEYLRYHLEMPDIAPLFGRLHITIRYAGLLLLIMSIIIFGAYGPGYNAANFIYFGF